MPTRDTSQDQAADSPKYVTLDDVLTEIEQAQTAPGQAPRRIALSITGGGARGAYEAGAVEAILQRLRAHGLSLDFIAGTSVGALVATGLFIDLLYPLGAPLAPLPYCSRQSLLWDRLSRRNQGARLVAGGQAEVLRVYSGEKALDSPLDQLTQGAVLWWQEKSVVQLMLWRLRLDLDNHLIDNKHLSELLLGLMRGAYGACHPGTQHARNVSQTVLADWKKGEQRPDLLICTSNLSAGRRQVFAVARPVTLRALADCGIWTVDLAGQNTVDIGGQSLGRVLRVVHDPCAAKVPETLSDAVITSAAVPLVFPPVNWHLRPVGDGVDVDHVFVDGGILDNSPVDVALAAGATHIISLELAPLRNQGWPQRDRRPYNLVTVLVDSLLASIDGSVRTSIEALVAANASAPHNQKSIYRLAPLLPAYSYDQGGALVRSLDLLDFDGAFDDRHRRVMAMYDWFVQGYLDALVKVDQSDPLWRYYSNPATRRAYDYVGNACPDGQNGFWRATKSLHPSTPELQARTLARQASYRV